MPWIKKHFSILKSNQSLAMKLEERGEVSFTSRVLISPFSAFTWLLLLASFVGLPLFLAVVIQVQPDILLPTTIIAVVIVLLIHCLRHFKNGLNTTITKQGITFPQEFIPSPMSNYINLSRIKGVHIQRYRFSFKVDNPGKWNKKIAIGEIYTHAQLKLNTGEKIDISRANLFAMPEIVEYISEKHSPTITYAFPTPLKILLLLTSLYFVILYFSKVY